MTNPKKRYEIKAEEDSTWAIVDTQIDPSQRDNRVVTGLPQRQAEALVTTLNNRTESRPDNPV